MRTNVSNTLLYITLNGQILMGISVSPQLPPCCDVWEDCAHPFGCAKGEKKQRGGKSGGRGMVLMKEEKGGGKNDWEAGGWGVKAGEGGGGSEGKGGEAGGGWEGKGGRNGWEGSGWGGKEDRVTGGAEVGRMAKDASRGRRRGEKATAKAHRKETGKATRKREVVGGREGRERGLERRPERGRLVGEREGVGRRLERPPERGRRRRLGGVESRR